MGPELQQLRGVRVHEAQVFPIRPLVMKHHIVLHFFFGGMPAFPLIQLTLGLLFHLLPWRRVLPA